VVVVESKARTMCESRAAPFLAEWESGSSGYGTSSKSSTISSGLMSCSCINVCVRTVMFEGFAERQSDSLGYGTLPEMSTGECFVRYSP
jgi:hypothetical protein